MNTGATGACPMCSNAATKCCSRCKGVLYCSKDCQAKDFPAHKLVCSGYTDFKEAPSQVSPDIQRALFFPEGSKKPQWIWMDVDYSRKEHKKSNNEDLKYPDVHDLLARSTGSPKMHSVGHLYTQWNSVHNRQTRYMEVVIRDNFFSDGSSPSQSIKAATQGSAYHGWRGPAVVLGYTAKEHPSDVSQNYMNVEMSDYRDIVDFFVTYNNPSRQPPESREKREMRDELKRMGFKTLNL